MGVNWEGLVLLILVVEPASVLFMEGLKELGGLPYRWLVRIDPIVSLLLGQVGEKHEAEGVRQVLREVWLVFSLESLVQLEPLLPLGKVHEVDIAFSDQLVKRFSVDDPLSEDLFVVFSSLGLLLDVHVELEGLGVFLAAVLYGKLLAFDAAVLDVGVESLDIEVSGISETKLMSVPSTHVKMSISVLVEFSADATLEELVAGVGACRGAERL